MNKQNNKLFFDYKDKDCNYCPTRPILEQFKNYTESPENCEHLRNYIATEICHTKRTNSTQQRYANKLQTLNSEKKQPFNANHQQFAANQRQKIDPNQQQPYRTNYNPLPRIDLNTAPAIKSHFIDLNKCNQSDSKSVPENSVPVGCYNNNEYICFKTSSPPILIQGPICQGTDKGVSCCFQNSNNQVPNANQAVNPPPTQRQPDWSNRAVKCPPNSRKQPKPCNRENCVHKTPENICLYNQPCKAHCFNTPPRAGRRNA